MSRVSREAFADEASWLEFQRNTAKLARRAAKPTPAARPHLDLNSPAQKLWRRMRHRAQIAKWRAANPERSRQLYRQYRASHIEICRERNRRCMNRWYREHHEEALLRAAVNYRDHREYRLAWQADYRARNRDDINRKKRETGAAKRRALGARDRSAEARVFEVQVVEGREAGFSWSEIGALLSKHRISCREAYLRAMQRQVQQQEGGAA